MNFDNIIVASGTSATLKTVTLPAANGNDAETYSDTIISVIFNTLTEKTLQLSEGRLKEGDMMGYVKTSVSINERDIIV